MGANDKKCTAFPDMESLQRVVNIINEAAYALDDDEKIIANSSISDALLGVIGAGVGSASSLAALYGLGSTGFSASGITSGLAAAGSVIGAGMLAGIAVLSMPVAALAGLGVYITPDIKAKLLHQERKRLYQEALKKHEAIVRAIKKEVDASKERKEQLQSLSILLAQIIKDLQNCLETA